MHGTPKQRLCRRLHRSSDMLMFYHSLFLLTGQTTKEKFCILVSPQTFTRTLTNLSQMMAHLNFPSQLCAILQIDTMDRIGAETSMLSVRVKNGKIISICKNKKTLFGRVEIYKALSMLFRPMQSVNTSRSDLAELFESWLVSKGLKLRRVRLWVCLMFIIKAKSNPC